MRHADPFKILIAGENEANMLTEDKIRMMPYGFWAQVSPRLDSLGGPVWWFHCSPQTRGCGRYILATAAQCAARIARVYGIVYSVREW